jgi:phosphomannomutase / phosphoglucomutase
MDAIDLCGLGEMDPFKDCDVRGLYPGEVNEDLAFRLGRAVAELAMPGDVAVGGDVRLSTRSLMGSLTEGLLSGGRNVVDLGILPTPAYYFELRRRSIPAGVMVTGSHNPPSYNGFKPRLGPTPVTPQDLRDLKRLCGKDLGARPRGTLVADSDIEPYMASRIGRFAGMAHHRVVIDSGNGALSHLAPMLFRRLGCDVIELFCEPDGHFPNRSPNTADTACLKALSKRVIDSGADLGLAFDGDGDRVVVVLSDGTPVRPDPLTALLAREVLKDAPGRTVVHDTRCSNVVPEVVRASGGVPMAERSGHSAIEARMLKENAVLGAEISGHYFFEELHGIDDGLFAGAMVVSLLAQWGSLAERLAELPSYVTLPEIRVPWDGDRDAELAALREGLYGDAKLTDIDGIRADWPDAWGLARVSMTEPMITFRFEGRSREALASCADRFMGLVSSPLREALRERLAILLPS